MNIFPGVSLLGLEKLGKIVVEMAQSSDRGATPKTSVRMSLSNVRLFACVPQKFEKNQ